MTSMVMRDALINRLYEKMKIDTSIFFVSADFGSPALDKLREDFPERFINVGIAEQNLISVAVGMALEGFNVYAYAIAPFLSMRGYEQMRTSVAIMSQVRKININFISVGAGLSYDVTGPTHHCLEDSCIMNVLPNFLIFSPSDSILTEKFVEFANENCFPKYIRLDGKAQPLIYSDNRKVLLDQTFHELRKGKDICIISTGYMTHKAIRIADRLEEKNISAGIIDVYILKPVNDVELLKIIKGYNHVVTMEESFLNKGSLDTIVERICFENRVCVKMNKIGFKDKYVFDVGDREYLYEKNGIGEQDILSNIIKTHEMN